MAEAGRNTILTEELFKQIRQSILDGNDLRKTAVVCEINEGTLYVWHSDNYLNIADKVLSWKHERMLKLAEMNLEAIMCLGIGDKETVKVVADVSKFTAETLGKAKYSKRNELTGSEGGDIKVTNTHNTTAMGAINQFLDDNTTNIRG